MKIAHLLFAPDHRLEEAETNLVAKQEANALLNSQVDILTKQLQELQAGKAAYEKHVKDLTALLAKERRKHPVEQVAVHSNHKPAMSYVRDLQQLCVIHRQLHLPLLSFQMKIHHCRMYQQQVLSLCFSKLCCCT